MRYFIARLIFHGRIRPDDDVQGDYCNDLLPCLVELRRVVAVAQEILEVHDGVMRTIAGMAKVQNADFPKATALALYLFDGENSAIRTLARLVEARGLHILSYVFDGLYVLVNDMASMQREFKLIARDMYDSTRLQIALKDASGVKLYVYKPSAEANVQS